MQYRFRETLTSGIIPVLGLLALGLTLAGCAGPHAQDSHAQTAPGRPAGGTATPSLDADPVSAPISVAQILDRALRFNLDARMQQMTTGLQTDIEGEPLPQLAGLAAAAGFKDFRSDGTSEPGLVQSWHILDYSLTKLQAGRQNNRELAASVRRKATENILREARARYWQVASLDRLQAQAQPLLREVGAALGNPGQAGASSGSSAGSGVDAARAQKTLLDIMDVLGPIDHDDAQARAELASLIHLPPGTDFTVEPIPASADHAPQIAANQDALFKLALANRPELQVADKSVPTPPVEPAVKILLAHLPPGRNSDEQSDRADLRWAEGGLTLANEIVQIDPVPGILDSGRTRQKMAEERRGQIAAGITNQLALALRRYSHDQSLFLRADRQAVLESQIQHPAGSSQIDRLKDQADSLIAAENRDRRLADLQDSAGLIYDALGLDAVPIDHQSPEVKALASEIAGIGNVWGGSAPPMVSAAPAQPRPMVEAMPAPTPAPTPAATKPEPKHPEPKHPEPTKHTAPTKGVVTQAEAVPGGIQVQLSSESSTASADDEWRHQTKAHPDLLKDLKPTVIKADLGSRGIWYRLLAGPLPTPEAAASLCQALHKAGVGCNVLKH